MPDLDTVIAPASLVGGVSDVGLQLRGQLGQVQENVLGGSQHRCGAGDLAFRVDQVCRVQQVAAAVTLVSSCILRRDHRYFTTFQKR